MSAPQSVLIRVASCASPVGDITLAVKDGALCALGFADHWEALRAWLERRFAAKAIRWEGDTDPCGFTTRMRAYVAGELHALDDMPVDPGGTPFQHQVWMALRQIPVGRTMSYGDLAQLIGTPTASRAVGAANGANPISIVIPCHRVIGTNGKLTGYGGGLHRKRWLLGHEGLQLAFDA